MLRMREHIDRLDALDAVAVPGEVAEVARERLRVARHVHHPLRRHGRDGGEKALVAAGARRVEDDDVGVLAGFGHALQEVARIGGIEADVIRAVSLGVADRIAHGVAVILHADHARGIPAGENADRAGAAVGVHDGLRAGQPRVFERRAVEHLRLDGVDLIKRARRDAEREITELLADISRSVEHLAVRPEYETRLPGVDVLHHGRDVRMLLQQRAHEVSLAGQHTVRGHEHDEDLPAAPAAPHEHVPQRAAAGVLIVGADLEALEQLADRDDDPVGDLILDQAVADRDDAVRGRLIHARDDLSLPVDTEGGLHLVAVVIGVVHAEDLLNMTEAAEQPDGRRLFEVQLLRVGEVLQLAAAALFCKRAYGRVGHGEDLRFRKNSLLSVSHHSPLFHTVFARGRFHSKCAAAQRMPTTTSTPVRIAPGPCHTCRRSR